MKYFTLILLLISANASSYSDEMTSSEFRQQHTASIDLQYSLLSLPFPGSKGLAFNYNLGKDWQLVIDYMSTGVEVNFSKLNLAGFNETQLGIKARRYYGNSFNLGFGYVRRSNEIYLDPNIYGISTTDVNARTEAHANLAHFSIANRWQFDHWSAGIEWLSLNIPLGGEVSKSVADLASDSSDKKDIRSAEDVLTWYPNIATMTFSLGYMF
jgi:hypothetical protein